MEESIWVKMTTAIHFQYTNDDGEMAKKLVSLNRPFIISVPSVLLDRDLKTDEGKKFLDEFILQKIIILIGWLIF